MKYVLIKIKQSDFWQKVLFGRKSFLVERLIGTRKKGLFCGKGFSAKKSSWPKIPISNFKWSFLPEKAFYKFTIV